MGNSPAKLLDDSDPEYRLCQFNAPDDPGHTTLSSDAFVDWCLGKVAASKLDYFLVYKFTTSADFGTRLHREVYAVSLSGEAEARLARGMRTDLPRRNDVLSYEYVFTRNDVKHHVSLGSLVGLYKNLHVVDSATWDNMQQGILELR
jgi:hypothetical protein